MQLSGPLGSNLPQGLQDAGALQLGVSKPSSPSLFLSGLSASKIMSVLALSFVSTSSSSQNKHPGYVNTPILDKRVERNISLYACGSENTSERKGKRSHLSSLSDLLCLPRPTPKLLRFFSLQSLASFRASCSGWIPDTHLYSKTNLVKTMAILGDNVTTSTGSRNLPHQKCFLGVVAHIFNPSLG